MPEVSSSSPEALLLVDHKLMRFTLCDQAALRVFDFNLPLPTAPWTLYSISRRELESIYERLIAADGIPSRMDLEIQRSDRATRRVEIWQHARLESDRWQIVAVARDVTHERAAETALKHLTRLYAVVSGVNDLVLRAQDRDELYKAACRVAVDQGEFTSAWVGVLSSTEQRILPVASAGLDDRALTNITAVFAASPAAMTGEGLAGRALRSRAPVISNNVQSDQAAMFSQEYAEAGVQAVGVFPLIIADRVVGILALRSKRREYFDPQGVKLLTEVTNNIAYAIDHIERQELLNYRAFFHELTGLANRRLFLDRVVQYLRLAAETEGKAALFFIDLERFRSVNSSLGRAAGDSLLIQVAKWLEEKVQNTNDLAHLGTDQFAIIAPRVTDEMQLIETMETMIEAFLGHSFNLNGEAYRVAAKVGVAIYPDDGGDADTLLQHSEAALKKAKVSGDRHVFYAQRMSETIVGALELENQLRRALEREELVLHYQPKFAAHSGRLTGAECRISSNWTHLISFEWDHPISG